MVFVPLVSEYALKGRNLVHEDIALDDEIMLHLD